MFKRIWAYLKALFTTTAEKAMDPKIEIEAAINEAKKKDQDLRNQAAKVIAHRTQLESQIGRAADSVGEAARDGQTGDPQSRGCQERR